MKKRSLTFAVLMIILLFVSFSYISKNVRAKNSNNYIIKNVNHKITIMYNGYIIINDTITIMGNSSHREETIETFTIGFPFQYGAYILDCIVNNAAVNVNVPLDERLGFYAVEIVFPEPLNITIGKEHTFTANFILSNDLIRLVDADKFTLDFPAYPSLPKSAANCTVELELPEAAMDITIVKEDENIENATKYFKENLSAFAYFPANLTFSLSGDELQLFEVEELKREITISGLGEISGSDNFYIVNEMSKEISAIEVVLPFNASILGVYDQFGRKFKFNPSLIDTETNRYRITLTLPLESYKSTKFNIKYSLPNQEYLNKQGEKYEFNFSSLLFRNIDYYVRQYSLSFIFPEGARLLAPKSIFYAYSISITRTVFQETMTLNLQGVNPLNNILPSENAFQIIYTYNPLWLSFRPTLWIWALSIIVCAIVFVWKRPKAAVPVTVPTVAVRLSPEIIKSFVTSYEEKKGMLSELESLETGAKKRKIPRRRYKVRKRMLETRLNTLSRRLTEYKEKMRAAGGKYADLMRQLEVAETEINEVESNIRSIEVRHRRGDLSLEAYRKLLADYKRRKEQAETTINGVLLRIREDIR